MADQSSRDKAGDVGEASPHLDSGERDQAAQHAAPRGLVIHEIIREDGELDLSRTASALAFSGLAAGLSLGFSFLGEALLRASLPPSIWRHTVDSFGYSIGFIIVILGRQQLFTESTLTAILPVVTRLDRKTFVLAARLWAIVLAANMVGAWIFAGLLTIPGVFPPPIMQSLHDIAAETMAGSFTATMLKAFFAGWLIALMVWILPSARSARLWTILIITYMVALGHLPHIIAGSAEGGYGVMVGLGTIKTYLLQFALPTLCGNILGGVLLVTVLNHGSIAPEMQGRSQ